MDASPLTPSGSGTAASGSALVRPRRGRRQLPHGVIQVGPEIAVQAGIQPPMQGLGRGARALTGGTVEQRCGLSQRSQGGHGVEQPVRHPQARDGGLDLDGILLNESHLQTENTGIRPCEASHDWSQQEASPRSTDDPRS